MNKQKTKNMLIGGVVGLIVAIIFRDKIAELLKLD